MKVLLYLLLAPVSLSVLLITLSPNLHFDEING